MRDGVQADPGRLAKALHLHPITAKLLINRGYEDPERARAFLHPLEEALFPPDQMRDMDRAVAKLREASALGQRILVYGDYDADGLCATAILADALREVGVEALTYIPHRLDEGYGLTPETVQRVHERGAELIVTVDCGVTSLPEVEQAYGLGMQVIVTDHHQRSGVLPTCEAVLHPHFCPYTELTGAGVALKLACALTAAAAPKPGWLQLAALGTVCDLAPISGENRRIVSRGLAYLAKDPLPGLAALLEVAGAAGRPITADTLGYVLGPRINAAGRMGDATRSLQLLCAASTGEALPLARELNEENARRQRAEADIVEGAARMLEAEPEWGEGRAIVLYDPQWSSGIVGIAAARIAQAYHKPTIILGCNDGYCTGSGRSIPSVNLYDAMHACADLFARFGGHAFAAGVTLLQDRVPEFRRRLNEALAGLPEESFVPEVQYDLELAETPDLDLAKEIARLAPFDRDTNPQPLFRVQGPVTSMRRIGADRNTLRLELGGLSGVGFRMGAMAEEWHPGKRYDMLANLNVNAYMGRESAQWVTAALREDPGEWEGEISRRKVAFGRAIFHQVMYNGAIPKQPEPADWPEVLAALREEARGVLIALSAEEDALQALALFREAGLADRLDVAWNLDGAGPNWFNRLWLAPNPLQLPERLGYRRIYYTGVAFPDARARRLPGAAPAVRLSREDVAKVYRWIRRGMAADAEELAQQLAGELASAQVWLALQVLRELELIAPEGLELRPATGKRDLLESETMRKVYMEGR